MASARERASSSVRSLWQSRRSGRCRGLADALDVAVAALVDLRRGGNVLVGHGQDLGDAVDNQADGDVVCVDTMMHVRSS
jgi:hypothetical protein